MKFAVISVRNRETRRYLPVLEKFNLEIEEVPDHFGHTEIYRINIDTMEQLAELKNLLEIGYVASYNEGTALTICDGFIDGVFVRHDEPTIKIIDDEEVPDRYL